MYEAQTATVSGINKLVDGVKSIYNQLTRLSDLQSQFYRGEITQEEYEQAQEDISDDRRRSTGYCIHIPQYIKHWEYWLACCRSYLFG